MTFRATWEFKAIFLSVLSALFFLAYLGCILLVFWMTLLSGHWPLLVLPLLMLIGATVWGYGFGVFFARAYRLSIEQGTLEWVSLGTLLPSRVRIKLTDLRGIYQLQPHFGMQRIELAGEKRSWILRGALSEADARDVMQAIFDEAEQARSGRAP